MANDQAATAARVDSWLRTAAERYPAQREAVIPLLQAAQAEFGYLPREALEGIARRLRLPPALVQGIATFYAQFRFRPPGKHTATVCRGTACHVRGSAALLRDLSERLGVRPQETTADGSLTLETVACFGSCALGPVMVVDGKVYGRQTTAAALRTLARVRAADPRRGKAPRRGGRR
jgi:NADH:ubiquinone oxidoreductase subunit E